MGQKYAVRARIRVTVEMDIPQRWEGGCPPEQVFKQARDHAEDALRKGLVIHHLKNSLNKTAEQHATVVDHKVTAVLFEEE